MNETLTNDPKYKDMKLVATVYGDDQPENRPPRWKRCFPTTRPKGVIAPTTVALQRRRRSCSSAAIADQVKVTGLGLPSEMRDFVKDGTVKAFQLWSPYNEGWLGRHFAVGLKNGTIKNEVGQTFEVPNLGTITIGPKNVMNTQAELTKFDANNIDEFNF
jgi:rhamnose transport system substrate-binding protein